MSDGRGGVRLASVSFTFREELDDTKVLQDISAEFCAGEITAIVGPSGCGKTTLLNLLAGLFQIPDGVIYYSVNHRRVGYVFQTASLIPWRTIRRNALFGAEITGTLNPECYQECDRLLGRFGLGAFKDELPRKLSGGMQQRVSIIRAVLSGASILLLDEPFSNSDYMMRLELQKEVSGLVNERDLIAVFVTHDIDEAARMGDKVLVMSHRPATIVEEIEIGIPREERLQNSVEAQSRLLPYVEKIWHAFPCDDQHHG